MAFKNPDEIINKSIPNYDMVKGVLDKANVDFKDDASWEHKMDYIREALKDSLDIDETMSDIYLKDNKLYGLQTYPKGEPQEIELYKWEK